MELKNRIIQYGKYRLAYLLQKVLRIIWHYVGYIFVTRLVDIKSNGFTKEDRILIKVLRVTVPESCWRNSWQGQVLFSTGPTSAALTLQGLQTRSPAAAENVRSAQETYKCLQMATILSTNCNWWYCVRTAKATFPYWKLLFLSFMF